jgi:hypothetical protein
VNGVSLLLRPAPFSVEVVIGDDNNALSVFVNNFIILMYFMNWPSRHRLGDCAIVLQDSSAASIFLRLEAPR